MKNCLRSHRKKRGLSQLELADAVEVTRQSIIAMEAEKYDPSLPMAYRMAAFFHVPVETLFYNQWKESEAIQDKGDAICEADS
ncbi:helix-turn-helix transcriptional regulator [Parasphingorhabdus sp. DH2-15]|uniref:helix-turn-helix transcriptional regulator n=1 Tax=Parasphingorhabdus sp. DH2-15 TaxID=3444112 RepID=UPI003F68304C